jgi:hypothetical protein
MAFQNTNVGTYPAPGIEGDFASANPRGSMLAGQGAFVSGPNGVVVGRFARAANATGIVTNNDPGVPSRIGFVHKDQLVGITPYLGVSGMTVLPGVEITLHDSGDFLVRFAAGATVGQKVFASYADGSAIAGNAGGTVPGATVTASAGGTATANTTNGSNQLAVTAIASGNAPMVGDLVTGTGIPANSTITAVPGTPTGNYTLSQNATATGTGVTVTVASNKMVVSAVASGALAAGQPISGTNVAANTTIASMGTATGGVGTYTLSSQQTFASTTVTALGGYETKWYVDGDPSGPGNTIAAGALGMISTRG